MADLHSCACLQTTNTYRQSSRGEYKDKDKAGLYSVCACLKKTKGETKVKLKGKYKDKDKILHIYTLVLVLKKAKKNINWQMYTFFLLALEKTKAKT